MFHVKQDEVKKTPVQSDEDKIAVVKAVVGNSINFFVGNPNVETSFGALHLYRDVSKKPSEKPESLPASRGLSICIIAVPAHYSAADFCSWIAKFNIPVTYMRILRDASLYKYMVLLTFPSQEHADLFYMSTNGKPFNTLEPERCHGVFVASVESETDGEVNFLGPPGSAPVPGKGEGRSDFADDGKSPCSKKPPASDSIVELPSCPVCLERLDFSASGVFTTVCAHNFHADCLSKWSDSKCPVCRYCHNDEMHQDTEVSCEICGASESLWICLVCGHVGCGRYKQEHGLEHYNKTGHVYAMELSTQRVWDYVGDGYVHRLIRNEEDGKFVEMPDPSHSTGGERSQVPPVTDMTEPRALRDKLETQTLDFVKILSDQRRMYENELESLRTEIQKLNETTTPKKTLMEVREELKAAQEENNFLKTVNSTLVANQAEWEKKVKMTEKKLDITKSAYEAKITGLEAEVQDLMFYLDTQGKVEQSANKDQIQSGVVVVSETEGAATAGGRRSGGNSRSSRRKS